MVGQICISLNGEANSAPFHANLGLIYTPSKGPRLGHNRPKGYF